MANFDREKYRAGPPSKRALISQIALYGLAFLLIGTLSACGKKPTNLDPPLGVEDREPPPYPDPNTDPAPDPASGAPDHAPARRPDGTLVYPAPDTTNAKNHLWPWTE